MKVSVTETREKTIDIAAVRCIVAVCYDEEDMPRDFPFRNGDLWDVTIDADSGRIQKWPAGKTAEIYMKVCDQGSYYLLDSNGRDLANLEHDYVPACIPGDYGDYLGFTIGADGSIAEWADTFTADAIQASFFGEDD